MCPSYWINDGEQVQKWIAAMQYNAMHDMQPIGF